LFRDWSGRSPQLFANEICEGLLVGNSLLTAWSSEESRSSVVGFGEVLTFARVVESEHRSSDSVYLRDRVSVKVCPNLSDGSFCEIELVKVTFFSSRPDEATILLWVVETGGTELERKEFVLVVLDRDFVCERGTRWSPDMDTVVSRDDEVTSNGERVEVVVGLDRATLTESRRSTICESGIWKFLSSRCRFVEFLLVAGSVSM
jgi:hypothetical protein